jgi:catechol 2,3-dioxygenase-like lactoylglutathione lyase family enzyme
VRVRRVVPDFHADEPLRHREFYEDVLGLKLGMDLGWVATFQSPSNETAQLTLLSADATASVVPNVSIEVEDVDAVHAEAQRRGHEIVHPLTDEPWGVRRFFVRSPDGIVFNVVQHRDPTK